MSGHRRLGVCDIVVHHFCMCMFHSHAMDHCIDMLARVACSSASASKVASSESKAVINCEGGVRLGTRLGRLLSLEAGSL